MEHKLRVGESARIRGGLLSQHEVIYAGMPSDNTYSLTITYAAGYQRMGYNLFLPTNHREVWHKKGHITVLSVSPGEIHLRIDK
ncbi:MAG: hypothetical protein KAW91_06880 [candidate division Zixibacteria bacterium]|nr:hypothetical protein [candidate division Zixibacteria bacterium]